MLAYNTQALLAAIPIPDPVVEAARAQHIVAGEVPSVLHPPSGCGFHPRCPKATARCAENEPALAPTGRARAVACHLVVN